jgi:hypothetical protein
MRRRPAGAIGLTDGPAGERPGDRVECHREHQSFHWGWRALATVLAVGATLFFGLVAVNDPTMAGFAWVAAAVTGWAVIVVTTMFGAITVLVDEENVVVSAGALGWPRWRFPLAEIESCEVTSFSLAGEWGGYGFGPASRTRVCIVADGRVGVEIALRGRVRRYVIGSSDPARLCRAISQAMLRSRYRPDPARGD